MAGIVNSTKKRFVINKRIKEVEVPGSSLNTALFLSDLPSVGVTPNAGLLNQELAGLPTIAKNEATTALVGGATMIGRVFGMNGDTKSIEGFSFSRNSAATRWASDGKIYTVAPNDVRYDQDPKSGAYKGMLFEKAATNLLTYSGFPRGLQDLASSSSGYVNYTDTTWNKGSLLEKGVSIVHNPAAVSWAYKQHLGAVVNNSYTFSCFLKMSDGLSPVGGIKVNMFNVLYTDFILEDIGVGVYRLVITKKFLAGGNNYVGIVKESSGDNRTVVVTGYQLEESEIATTYIPTDSSIGTRLEEVLTCERQIDHFPEYSVFIKGYYVSSKLDNQSSMFILKDASARYWFHTYTAAQPENIRAYNGIGGITIVAQEKIEHKVAVRRDLTNYSMCVNAGSVQTDNSLFPLVQQNIVIRGSQAAFTLRALAIIPRKLSDAELISITS